MCGRQAWKKTRKRGGRGERRALPRIFFSNSTSYATHTAPAALLHAFCLPRALQQQRMTQRRAQLRILLTALPQRLPSGGETRWLKRQRAARTLEEHCGKRIAGTLLPLLYAAGQKSSLHILASLCVNNDLFFIYGVFACILGRRNMSQLFCLMLQHYVTGIMLTKYIPRESAVRPAVWWREAWSMEHSCMRASPMPVLAERRAMRWHAERR